MLLLLLLFLSATFHSLDLAFFLLEELLLLLLDLDHGVDSNDIEFELDQLDELLSDLLIEDFLVLLLPLGCHCFCLSPRLSLKLSFKLGSILFFEEDFLALFFLLLLLFSDSLLSLLLILGILCLLRQFSLLDLGKALFGQNLLLAWRWWD